MTAVPPLITDCARSRFSMSKGRRFHWRGSGRMHISIDLIGTRRVRVRGENLWQHGCDDRHNRMNRFQ